MIKPGGMLEVQYLGELIQLQWTEKPGARVDSKSICGPDNDLSYEISQGLLCVVDVEAYSMKKRGRRDTVRHVSGDPLKLAAVGVFRDRNDGKEELEYVALVKMAVTKEPAVLNPDKVSDYSDHPEFKENQFCKLTIKKDKLKRVSTPKRRRCVIF
ncbi:hypothetical protein HDE_08533 [Halotydeus destructor]|nr:hypothetical protein HDE_08533 [Halotydeus destructor]